MAANTDEPTDPMILHRASGAEKLHRIFIFGGNCAHLVQEFLLAVLLLTAAPALGSDHWGGDRGGARILLGDTDVRIFALDGRPGIPCADFGVGGEVKIEIAKPLLSPGEFQIPSAPVVSRGVVIVGSSISDNVRVAAPLGTVRAFDARTGRPRWTWDPLVHNGIVAG